MTNVRKCFAASMLALFIVGALNLSYESALAQTMDEAKANGVTIAIANDPPLMTMNADGSPGGLGPEMDAAILAEAGITKYSGQVMEYGAMIPALQSKRATLSTSGALYIKPERCDAVLFSDPVSCNAEVLIVPATLADKVKTYKDVADQGLKIGVCGGCYEQKLALAAGVKEDNIVVFPDATSGIKLLTDKRIDVYAHDSYTGAAMFKRLDAKEMRFVRLDDLKSCAAAGFNKDSAALRDAYNEGLRKIRANGTYTALLKKYNFEEGAHVENVTTEKLCAK
ncbi:ectoine/hydroxyectoine ABC transporter substrate-binding protein EhuB [Mesorhizobium carmichaelinearum]|uniref:ectoine/hydroxyectoine ABC transporter substrate-binding protein EhuB n=1 Tax=Mesorhizobium carmichaelinearum TaxID=1208188 RepID=UPI0015C97189|nr:ectoine/hydroxyectoine ABC transporter substrate-binding protein EhuB [Mesorhizobium carmichaelinearum]